MLRREPCFGCACRASLPFTQRTRHAATIPNWFSEINVTVYSVTLARTIWLPDDGPRTETCRSVFNALMCKFYMCSSWYNNWVTEKHARCNNENRLRMFEKRVLRKIYGPKMYEVRVERRKLHTEELNDLYSSSNIIRVIKSRRIRRTGHVAHMGERRGVYRILVGKPEGKRQLGRPKRIWEDNIKMYLQDEGFWGMDLTDLFQGRDRCWVLGMM